VVLEVLDRRASRRPLRGLRLSRLLQIIAGELWLASCGWLGNLRGISGRSVREVEDILLKGGRVGGTAVRLAQREASASGVVK
jgi:hypothetical protein